MNMNKPLKFTGGRKKIPVHCKDEMSDFYEPGKSAGEFFGMLKT